MKLNKLEKALLDDSGGGLDLYLDETPTMQVMADIDDIKTKATLSTDAGVLREKVRAVLDEVE